MSQRDSNRTRVVTALLASGMAVVVGFSGCGTGSKPRTQTQSPPAAPPALPAAKAALPPPQRVGDVEKLPTTVLTKSVARVIGFADVGGRTVSIFQDAYSALFGALQGKKGGSGGPAPKPLVYYSPVFVAGKATYMLTDEGMFRIVLPNVYTVEFVRSRVWDVLRGSLEAIGATRESVSVLPFNKVKATLKALGGTYEPQVASDLSRVTFELPKSKVPASLRDGSQLKVDPATGQPTLIGFIDSLEFVYAYNVQKVNETACAFDFDRGFTQNMYIDSTCPKEVSDVSETSLAQFEASRPDWKNLGALVQRASVPITSCLAGSEVARTLRRASVSCTRSLQTSSGARDNLGDELYDFSKKTYETIIDNAKLTDNPSDWNVQSAAAAVAMFGSPERFAQELSDFNSNVLNRDIVSDTSTEWAQSSDFLETLSEFQSRKMEEERKASGGGGGFLFLISFGGGSKSNSNRSNLEEVFSKLSTVAKKDRAAFLNKQFAGDFLNHEIVDVGGTLKFYPRVTFHVKADVNKIDQAAQALNVADLGDIVTENDAFAGEFAPAREFAFQGMVRCGANEFSFSKPIAEIDWWSSASFFNDVNSRIAAGIPPAGCESVSVSFWHDLPDGHTLVPSGSRPITIRAWPATGTPTSVVRALGADTRSESKAVSGTLSNAGAVITKVEIKP
jgi:hypothetical protein